MPVASSLETVLFRQHVRMGRGVQQRAGPRLRLMVELACGAAALLSTVSLAALHARYVAAPEQPVARALSEAVAQMRYAPTIRIVLTAEDHAGCSVTTDAAPGNTFWFARDRGVALLTEDARKQLRVTIVNVKCGGNAVPRFVESESVVANAVLTGAGRGWLKAERSGELYDLSVSSSNSWAVAGRAAFVLFATSTLVHYTLRETQARMLRFTAELRETISSRRSYARLVTRHLLDSAAFAPIMVGMLAFLFEFFADQILGLTILTLVWGVELFVAVSVRARASVLFLPQILMAYLAALHCYLFKWPFGFRYVALGACILYILHACCFFFNRHELKALREGSVSAALPRDTGPACDAVSTSRRSPPRRQHTD